MSKENAFETGRLYLPLAQIAAKLTAAHKDTFIRLPALQAYIPMSVMDELGKARDHAGGVDIFQIGTVLAGYDGNSYRQLGNGTNYLQVFSSVYNMTGTETFVDPALRGFTIGAWFSVDELPVGFAGMISKDGPSPQRGYALVFTVTPSVIFAVSGDGLTTTDAAITPVPTKEWIFAVGRFIPSTEVAVIVDGVKASNTTSVPASCFESTQAFEIGRFSNDNTRILSSKCRDVLVCRGALSDELIEEVRVASAP